MYLRTAAALPNGLLAEQSGTNGFDDQTSLRAELFSADQMEFHGSALAHRWAYARARLSSSEVYLRPDLAPGHLATSEAQ